MGALPAVCQKTGVSAANTSNTARSFGSAIKTAQQSQPKLSLVPKTAPPPATPPSTPSISSPGISSPGKISHGLGDIPAKSPTISANDSLLSRAASTALRWGGVIGSALLLSGDMGPTEKATTLAHANGGQTGLDAYNAARKDWSSEAREHFDAGISQLWDNSHAMKPGEVATAFTTLMDKAKQESAPAETPKTIFAPTHRKITPDGKWDHEAERIDHNKQLMKQNVEAASTRGGITNSADAPLPARVDISELNPDIPKDSGKLKKIYRLGEDKVVGFTTARPDLSKQFADKEYNTIETLRAAGFPMIPTYGTIEVQNGDKVHSGVVTKYIPDAHSDKYITDFIKQNGMTYNKEIVEILNPGNVARLEKLADFIEKSDTVARDFQVLLNKDNLYGFDPLNVYLPGNHSFSDMEEMDKSKYSALRSIDMMIDYGKHHAGGQQPLSNVSMSTLAPLNAKDSGSIKLHYKLDDSKVVGFKPNHPEVAGQEHKSLLTLAQDGYPTIGTHGLIEIRDAGPKGNRTETGIVTDFIPNARSSNSLRTELSSRTIQRVPPETLKLFTPENIQRLKDLQNHVTESRIAPHDFQFLMNENGVYVFDPGHILVNEGSSSGIAYVQFRREQREIVTVIQKILDGAAHHMNRTP